MEGYYCGLCQKLMPIEHFPHGSKRDVKGDIFVDELFTMTPRTEQARRLGNRWCHMTTNGNLETLHLFAERLGLKRSWFQPHATLPHYDLIPSKRTLALKLGAKEITRAEQMKAAREAYGVKPESTPMASSLWDETYG